MDDPYQGDERRPELVLNYSLVESMLYEKWKADRALAAI